MTIQQVCTFYLKGSYFGIEIEQVQEIIRQPPLTRIPLAPPDICGLMNLRGQVIPVVDLPCRLGLRSASCGIGEETTYNVIVNTIDDVISFIVEDIGDILSCDSETFEPPPANLTAHIRGFLKGAYKLEQGFLLILDTIKISDSTKFSDSTLITSSLN
ncbi:chemotaxis protein CheW [Leptolyngbya sp. FACHB-17]|uniref:chemotaxis protein CheW n=1 Tax=unclassified Leptolyngbya TaxID=2650499 RepID=UPI00167FE44A|nr:chemotaxis protein CheW [Leptolyngbya sp. FACHB-17]MBD2079052.1 purine-binding chemotaxis protein CheW [Leptolyngbya sp. FACHB-17]